MEKDKFDSKSIKGEVLGQIENHQLKMKPRSRFVLKTILAVLGMLILFLVLCYLVGLGWFVLRQSGLAFLPSFGWSGLVVLILSLPWLIILTVIVFVFLLQALLRQYPAAYRKPLLISLLAIVFLAGLVGLWTASFDFHHNLWRVREGPARVLYRDYALPFLGETYVGEILEVTDEGLVIISDLNQEKKILISEETRLPRGSGFAVGRRVVVWGEHADGEVRAKGVRPANGRFHETEDFNRRPSRPRE